MTAPVNICLACAVTSVETNITGGMPLEVEGVKFGDSIEETIFREVKEECGADVIRIEFLGFREVFREHNGQKTHWVAFDHRVEIDSAQVYITEPDKCLELRWCAIDEIPEPMHSQFPFFLEKYKDLL